MDAFDRATDVVTLALGPGYAVSAERSCLWEVCPPTGSGPPCSPGDHSPGKAGLGCCSIHHLASTGPLRARSAGHAWMPLPYSARWLWPGSVLVSRTVLNRGLGPDSPHAPSAGPRAGFLGPVSHGCCHDPAPPRRAASCCDVRAAGRRPPAGGSFLDGRRPEAVGR